MSVTRNFILLTLLGGVLTLIVWPFGLAFTMFLFWNLLLLCLFILDIILTPRAKYIKVRRHVYENSGNIEQSLYFKIENEIVFFVQNTSKHTLRIECKDSSNRFLKVVTNSSKPEEESYKKNKTKTNLIHWVKAGTEQVFSYNIIPSKRGHFILAKIHMRYMGLLGLYMKYTTAECPIDLKVYPNVRDLSKYRIMVQRSRLLPQGDKNIRMLGMSTEFESLRPYVIGDDYRKINWTATARENKFIVNQYQIERNQPVYILLDTGRPMSYMVNGYKKLDYAINAALILADIANQQGDKAGLIVYDSKIKAHISPGQGAEHRNQLMHTLYNVEDNRSTADYEGAFQTLCQRQKRRSIVFIFTDFEIFEEAEELINYIAILKRRHMPIVVFMANESLNELADNKTKKIQTRYDKILQKTAKEFQEERQAIFYRLSVMGIPNVESTAEDFAIASINKYMQLTKG